jgi:hypothetical protein
MARKIEIELSVNTRNAKAELRALEERADALDNDLASTGGTRDSGYSDAKRGIGQGVDHARTNAPPAAVFAGAGAGALAARVGAGGNIGISGMVAARRVAVNMLALGDMEAAEIGTLQSITKRGLPENFKSRHRHFEKLSTIRRVLRWTGTQPGLSVSDRITAAQRIASTRKGRRLWERTNSGLFPSGSSLDQRRAGVVGRILAPRKVRTPIRARLGKAAMKHSGPVGRLASSVLRGSATGLAGLSSVAGRAGRLTAGAFVASALLQATFTARGVRQRLEDLQSGNYISGIAHRISNGIYDFFTSTAQAAVRAMIEFTPGSSPKERWLQMYEAEKQFTADQVQAAQKSADRQIRQQAEGLSGAYGNAGWNLPADERLLKITDLTKDHVYKKIEDEIVGVSEEALKRQLAKQDK